jgi:hypothetical protein
MMHDELFFILFYFIFTFIDRIQSNKLPSFFYFLRNTSGNDADGGGFKPAGLTALL